MKKALNHLSSRCFHTIDALLPPKISYFFRFIRKNRYITSILGPRFPINLRRIEIDITNECNIPCFDCSRACSTAPTRRLMTTSQITSFIEECIQTKRQWDMIAILGGEPTLHPEFLTIVSLIREYTLTYSPETTVRVTTNGASQHTKDILKKLPPDILISNSEKSSPNQFHIPIHCAPIDSRTYRHADYTNGCFCTTYCGFGLSPYGYYPCGPGSTVDRIMGFNIGLKKLPENEKEMTQQLKTLCKYCGLFKPWINTTRATRHTISPTWEKALNRYAHNPPSLSLYT